MATGSWTAELALVFIVFSGYPIYGNENGILHAIDFNRPADVSYPVLGCGKALDAVLGELENLLIGFAKLGQKFDGSLHISVEP